MMLCDLSSGFNMSTNLSLNSEYNEMFGFTRDEVEWLARETGVDIGLIKVDMESCYNGYMFNNRGRDKVYNSQMVLYLFSQILASNDSPQIIDSNLRTDSERLRRLVEDENNLETMMRIIQNGGIHVSRIVDMFPLDRLNSTEFFPSYLFYLGMLTDGGRQRGLIWLKIPNYSIKTLYWEHIVNYIQDPEKKIITADKLSETISQMAYDGDIKPYLDFFTDSLLNRLSNRDLIKFDEKYIKVMMLATLFLSQLYLPVSEDENINGYTDIYLQKHPVIDDIKFDYVLEIKYIKKEAENKDNEKTSKLADALAQIEKYKKDPRFANRNDVKFFVIVFEGKGEYEAKEV
jgi:hypothetical protein